MNKIIAFFIFLFSVNSADSQTLFTYGNHAVSKQEFLKAYNKNKEQTADEKGAINNFLNLYSIFKMKVQAARELKLDTTSAFQADLNDFRSQIEENYLHDENQMNALVDEAFTRSQKDIYLVDYFISIPAQADTSAQLKNAVNKAYQLLQNINESNATETLERINASGLLITKSDFGFITVFVLPYRFEQIAYSLKPGEISKLTPTGKGWHVFKNIKERPAVGKIKIAQILIAAPEGAKELRENAKRKADSVYNLLQNGADFSDLVQKISDDKSSFLKGGEMPEFGIAQYAPGFEKEAFSLSKDGAISKPLETDHGFHLLKRIAAYPVPSSKEDAAFMFGLKNEVSQDADRMADLKSNFLKGVLIKTGYKNKEINDASVWEVTDSSLMQNEKVTIGKVSGNTPLFSFNDGATGSVADWIVYLRNSNKAQPGNLHESYKKAMPDFIEYAALENYRKRLATFNSDFKDQIEEFKEGNLLFEVMNKKVWNAALADSSKLLQYYNQHKEKYEWEMMADAIIFSCTNKEAANKAIAALKKGENWKRVQQENASDIKADSGRYQLAEIPVVDRTNFTKGLITGPVVSDDGSVIFAKIIDVSKEKESPDFKKIRGKVTEDFQNNLEEKWISELKKKYPVKVNQKVFDGLLR